MNADSFAGPSVGHARLLDRWSRDSDLPIRHEDHGIQRCITDIVRFLQDAVHDRSRGMPVSWRSVLCTVSAFIAERTQCVAI